MYHDPRRPAGQADPSAADPSTAGPSRPADLAPHEEDVAHLLGSLPRHDAPEAVRACVLAPVRRRGLLRLVPLGAWGAASAAALLLALGTAVLVEMGDGPATTQAERPAARAARDLTIVEDGRMTLFHDVETFDEVGLAPGRVLADWGR